MEQQPAERVLTAGRCAIQADARNVVVRIPRGDRFMPEDPVWESCVAKALPGDIMKRLRSIVRPHAVDLYDDKAELGGRLHRAVGNERLRDERTLRPSIDVLDHRIFLRRIEAGGPDDDAPD